MIDKRESENWTLEDHSDSGSIILRSKYSYNYLSFFTWDGILEVVELLLSAIPEEARDYYGGKDVSN